MVVDMRVNLNLYKQTWIPYDKQKWEEETQALFFFAFFLLPFIIR